MSHPIFFKSHSKTVLRKFIQQNFASINKASSYYFFAGYIYVAILARSMLTHSDALVKPVLDESIVTQWCRAELLDNNAFNNYEMQAESITNGKYITLDGQQVIRSYQPLAELMLIINATPDSFSDGGKYYNSISAIIERVEMALQDGVSIIDVGAESTRPNAAYIDENEEIQRLEIIINELTKLKQKYTFKISLDSYKVPTVKHFLAMIDIVNDVSNQLPLELIKLITENNKQYILMHSLTVPANPQINVATDCDVTQELIDWFATKLKFYSDNHINLDNIILDPGIGFNKTTTQAWQLIRSIDKFYVLGREVLVGHSRKSFFNSVTTNTFSNRDLETAVVSNFLANKMVDYLRIHEYKEYLLINNINNQLG